MTHTEVTAWLRERSVSCHKCAAEYAVSQDTKTYYFARSAEYATAANLIESLTAERDEARHRFGVAIREQMKTFAEKPNFMTFVQLKHGIVGDILHALQDGCITMGKACEALAEVAHGAEPSFAKSDLSPLADDVLPAEEIAKLTAERDGLAGLVVQKDEALRLNQETFQSQGRDPGHRAPMNWDERQALSIADQHGYGRLMQLLSSAWYAKVRGGAFAVGTCVSTAATIMRKTEAALTLELPAVVAQVHEWKEKAGYFDDLTMLIRRLCYRLAKIEGHSKMIEQAHHYLKKIDGYGDILRDVDAQAKPAEEAE